jgi:hypothetical protein
MASLTLRSTKGSPLTIDEVDNNFIALNNDVGTRLLTSTYTATDILTKIKTVDGNGSGLDADLLNGLPSNWTNQQYSIVARDSNGSFAAQTITAATFSGPLTGNVTGNVTGNLTGNSAGVHTGNVTGNLTGMTYGGHVGAVAGDVIGNLTGNVAGNVIGNTAGTHTGPVVGNVTGNLSGNADTVTNGVYTNGSYSNPGWITALAGSKVTAIPNSSLTNSAITINGNTVSLGGTTTIASGFGTGQTYSDVSGSRSVSVTYTNSTANLIWVSATITTSTYAGEVNEGESNSLTASVNGSVVWEESLTDPYWGVVRACHPQFFVPAGSTYRIDFSHEDGNSEYTIAVQRWVELR